MTISKSFSIPIEDFPEKLKVAAKQTQKRMLYITYILSPLPVSSEDGMVTFQVSMKIPAIMSILRPFSMIGNGDPYCNIVVSYRKEADGSVLCTAEPIDWALSTWDNSLNHKLIIKPLINNLFNLLFSNEAKSVN